MLERGVFGAPPTPLHRILETWYVVSFEQYPTRHTILQPPSYRCGLACHVNFSGTFMMAVFQLGNSVLLPDLDHSIVPRPDQFGPCLAHPSRPEGSHNTLQIAATN